ncbi:hypothetical protein CBR_g55223 [Chara braunii]|uniref:Uncharacterized protein n=1 Tax=Chara braunii TaxID=69332 RepID=A0A388MCV8_CHABU|nr:hypothetical protein CBR_g55223 [Chara braunii]|eukprot:GBG92343.1 hypothetical protein CBR_g55223 [Chara braunii]
MRSRRNDERHRSSASSLLHSARGCPCSALSLRSASMNRHRLSAFSLPADVPTFWQSVVEASLSFTIKPLDVPILDAVKWTQWWQAYAVLSFCLLHVVFYWGEPSDRCEEDKILDDELELLLVQAWRTNMEGDFLGILFGEVHDGHLATITDELLVFLSQLLNDLPLKILSHYEEKPGTATLVRTLEPACTKLEEGSYYMPSAGAYLHVDITDLSTWDPLIRRAPTGETSGEEEGDDEKEASAEEEDRKSDPDYRGSKDEELEEAGSEEEADEEENASRDSNELAELTREEREAAAQRRREAAEGKRPIMESGPPSQLL